MHLPGSGARTTDVPETQPWPLGLGDKRMANILTCCSWPNNWGIREACPNICRKEMGEGYGETEAGG